MALYVLININETFIEIDFFEKETDRNALMELDAGINYVNTDVDRLYKLLDPNNSRSKSLDIQVVGRVDDIKLVNFGMEDRGEGVETHWNGITVLSFI